MPLLDHFKPPVSNTAPWPALHSSWATFLTGQLNQGKLPPGYFAIPHVHFGTTLQVDVATLEQEEAEDAEAVSGNGGGVATAVWAPPAPPLVARVNLSDLNVLEVQVFLAEGRRLVAAIELVSPANKDRPAHRSAFVSKIAGFLQQDVGVVVVDVVTERLDNLHAELMELLGATDPEQAPVPDLYAAAYRATGKGKRSRLEMWPAPLAIGQGLPTLPLWIAADRAVPLDLDGSYAAACKMLWIR